MIQKHDNTGRPLREKQREVFDWLENVWDQSRIKVLRGATGLGKSLICEALRQSFDRTVIMIPSNNLIHQALETYPKANFVIGTKFYDSPESHQEARKRLYRGESTYVNPASFYRFKTKNKRYERPYLMVVDEFHVVARMMQLFVSMNLPSEKFGIAPSPEDDYAINNWFKSKISVLNRLAAATPDSLERIERFAVAEQISSAYSFWQRYPSKYVPENTSKGLSIVPIDIPSFIPKMLFDCEHLVIMSATPNQIAIENIVGKEGYIYKDFGGIIPIENRPIQFDMISDRLNRDTDPQIIAGWIKRQVAKHPDQNTIIHVPYAWQKKLAPHLPGFLTNTPKTKDATLKKFKSEGGVWLASGCSEGIDLPYDLCRVAIVPMLWKPNLGSKLVQKRISRLGQKVFDWEVIETFQQQVGRGVRYEDDKCKIIVGDPLVARLIKKYRQELPEDFVNSFKWSKE